MMEMFRPELAMAIDNGNQPLITVAECLECALRAEYSLAQVKEERAEFLGLQERKKSSQGACREQ